MRKIITYVGALLVGVVACTPKDKQTTVVTDIKANEYTYFGDSISFLDVLSREAMLEKYENLQKGDTLSVQFETEITQVCQKKGCWMNVELSDEQNSFVRFTDYGFFAPLNASGHSVIVEGRAFKTVVTVEELKHYAKDEGKSEAEIASITEPKVTYAFTADGIAIKND